MYFMKKRLLTILFSWAISLSYGQSFQVKDLAKSVGFWEGELTYLDYGGGQLLAQRPNEMHRIAKIKVDPKQLDLYKSLLNEQMLAAIKLEPGVLSYTVVADKKDASSITIFEIYANQEAYQSHILTAHFKKYKEAVKDMVLSLELIDVDLIKKTKKENMYQI
jgi:quinol monooxygenase YgiN